jgi:hypothetical protein
MLYRFMLILSCLFFYCLSAHAAQGPVGLRYLNEPVVHWNGNRLNGELKNVPVRGLLEDLLRGESYDCAVSGELKGNISISFENMTVEEIIRKIMRSNNYSYTLLTSGPAKPTGADHMAAIMELTIFTGGKTVQFTKVPVSRTTEAARIKTSPAPAPAAAAAPAPTTAATAPETAELAPAAPPSGVEIEKLDKEIKAFMDEMLAADKTSREEYETAMNQMPGFKK